MKKRRKQLNAEIEKQRLVVESAIPTHHPSIPKIERKKLATLQLERELLGSQNGEED